MLAGMACTLAGMACTLAGMTRMLAHWLAQWLAWLTGLPFFVKTQLKVSTACKLSMKFEPMKGKIKLTLTLIQPIIKFIQIPNFMGSLHAVHTLPFKILEA